MRKGAAIIAGLGLLAGAPIGAGITLPEAPGDADFMEVDPDEAELGRLLFFDPILSGNRNISCATCHHPRFGTSDGLSLGMGEGGTGLGPERVADPDNPPEQRLPRNSPALFNLGAREFTVLFHDGRIEVDPSRPSGLRTPLEDEMAEGFANLLSAQTMFPVLSQDEMAGHYGENDVSRAVRQGLITGEGGAWDIIAQRVAELDAYAHRFKAVYPHIKTRDEIGFTDISDAVAAFMAFEWRADDSAFDRHLRGQAPLKGAAAEGMELFYGRAGCAECHSGPFQTDHGFHAMGQPQLGPGRTARFERHSRDIGRARVTGDDADLYAFRTPSLRNVVHAGPWGHAGAFDDLAAFLRHHLDPVAGLAEYTPQAVLPELAAAGNDFAVMEDADEVTAIAAAVTRDPVRLDDEEIAALMAFLEALTDAAALEGRLGIPGAVPSGLPVER